MAHNKEELLNEIKRVSEECLDGEVPSTRDFNEHANISYYTFTRHYDESWEYALEQCGLNSDYSKRHGNIIPEQKILDNIKEISDKYFDGKTPKLETVAEKTEIHKSTYINKFDSWNNALEKLGFELNRGKEYSFEELKTELNRVSREFCDGKTPSSSVMKKNSDIALWYYTNKFGSWNNALRQLDFDPIIERSEYTKENLIREIKKISEKEEVGKPPNYDDMRKWGKYSCTAYQSKFGSWNNALDEAGFDEKNSHKNISDNQLINDIQRVSVEFCDGQTPKLDDIRDHGKFSESIYRKRFSGWNNAVQKAGFDEIFEGQWPVSGEKHPDWKGDESAYYGPSFNEEKKTMVRERDNLECRVCSQEQENIPTSLHVHHIKPRRVFVDEIKWFSLEEHHEYMNRPGNLISLCPSCHSSRIEGKWQDASPDEFSKKAKNFLRK